MMKFNDLGLKFKDNFASNENCDSDILENFDPQSIEKGAKM